MIFMDLKTQLFIKKEYKKGKMLGCVISHEQQISLFLTNKEKEMLERKGIEFIGTK